jgi:hypothetical protein
MTSTRSPAHRVHSSCVGEFLADVNQSQSRRLFYLLCNNPPYTTFCCCWRGYCRSLGCSCRYADESSSYQFKNRNPTVEISYSCAVIDRDTVKASVRAEKDAAVALLWAQAGKSGHSRSSDHRRSSRQLEENQLLRLRHPPSNSPAAPAAKFNEDMFNSIPFANHLLNRTYKSLSSWLLSTPAASADHMEGSDASEVSTKEDGSDDYQGGIRDNPLLATYWKMLGFGVPLESVMHKMKSDGVDGALRELFSSENGVSNTSSVTAARSSSKTIFAGSKSDICQQPTEALRIKFRKLHWEKVPSERAKRSLFNEANMASLLLPIRVSAFQFDQLVDSFSERPRAQAKQKKENAQPQRDKDGVRLLSFQRAQNIM